MKFFKIDEKMYAQIVDDLEERNGNGGEISDSSETCAEVEAHEIQA
jgi:Na+/melibiose symporter-like transporter